MRACAAIGLAVLACVLPSAATVWAEMAEAHDRGEKVEQWGGWVLSSDTFGGAR